MKKIVAIIIIVLAISSTNVHAQNASSYLMTRITGAPYSSIDGLPVPRLCWVGGDSVQHSIPIGFTFNYCGTNYTQVCASSIGWLSFNNALTDGCRSNSQLNMPGSGIGLLMPFWDSVTSSYDSVIYLTSGIAPNRVFSFEYRSSFAPGNVEVKLFETTNNIQFCYGSSWGTTGLGGTIGIANSLTDFQTLPSANVDTTSSSFIDSITEIPTTGTILNWQAPSHLSDSFEVFDLVECTGINFSFATRHYSIGQHVKTFLGNGTYFDTTLNLVGSSGRANFFEQYNFSGSYSIKHILYDGSLPVDSIVYFQNFSYCQNLSLGFYNDALRTCVYDQTADYLINRPVLIEIDSNSFPIDTISTTSGLHYTAYGNPGDIYRFKTITVPESLIFSCADSGIVIDTLGITSYYNTKYIGFKCDSGSGNTFKLSSFIPKHSQDEQWGWLYVYNTPCSFTGTLTMDFSPNFSYESMVTNPYTISGNTITWNLTGSHDSLVYVFFKLNSSFMMTIGDTIQNHVKVTPLDSDTLNNYMVIIDTIQAGCDPNGMSVSPKGCLLSTPGTTQLQYTLSFMNTGNDTAYNIYALDTLPNNVDISTMRMVMTSATMFISRIKDSAGQNIIKFDFPNINLLDSMHNPAKCAATTIFTINTKPGLPDGTTIDNRAGVYFDYNPVVMTNTVENIVGCPLSINRSPLPAPSLSLYPNPATTELTIKTTGNAYTSYTITNLIGQQMMAGAIIANDTKVNIAVLPAGVYFVTFSGENGDVVKKFVKM